MKDHSLYSSKEMATELDKELSNAKPILLIDRSRGISIPQIFCSHYDAHLPMIATDIIDICLDGPNHADYWAAWKDILSLAILAIEGTEYTLYHSDGLWAIPVGYDINTL